VASSKKKRWIGAGALALVLAVVVAIVGYLALAGDDDARVTTDRRPNVLVIMTDDQRLDDMRVMPITRERIGGAGITFENAFATFPLCCPSRTTLLTGQMTHNHKVFGNSPPFGGYLTYAPTQENSLPFWLRDSGYTTALVGKFMNGYGNDNAAEVPPGWDHWRGLPTEDAYRMWGFPFNEDGKVRTVGRTDAVDPKLYQTDFLADVAVGLIKKMTGSGKPFFLEFAPTAPHQEVGLADPVNPRPAPRHVGTLRGGGLPQNLAFNEEEANDKPEESRVKLLNRAQIRDLADHARGRLESLLAVDEAVGRMVDTLADLGVLDNTLIVFTSDNGYMLGEHRYNGRKYFPYDPSTRIPLLVRGPGVPRGAVSKARVLNVDVTATILESADVSPGRVMDGRSLFPLIKDPAAAPPRPILFEGEPLGELTDDPMFTGPGPGGSDVRSPGYVAVRSENWLWVVYERGGRELYDLKGDPDQVTNRAADPTLADLIRTLHGMVRTLQECQGENCWNVPAGP
jgi:arylsulfatase A-like enzyme